MRHRSAQLLTHLLLGATMCAALASRATVARACSAPDPDSVTVFPKDGATGVSLDVQPLIIGGGADFVLQSEAGGNVEIDLVELVARGLDPGESSDVTSSTGYGARRVVPQQPLQPNTTYQLVYGGIDTDAGPLQVFQFTTGESQEQPAPSVPEGFDLTFYAVHGADGAACEAPGQLELKGWDDGSLLEVCADYYFDDDVIDYPDWGEGEYCAEPQPGRRCTLASEPHFVLWREFEFVLWIELVEVRALGLNGQVSEVRRFGRGDFPQLEVRLDEEVRVPSAVESPVEIVLTGEGDDTVREPAVCSGQSTATEPPGDGSASEPSLDGEGAAERDDGGTRMSASQGDPTPGEPSAESDEEPGASQPGVGEGEEPEVRIRSNRCSLGAGAGATSWWAFASLGLLWVRRQRRTRRCRLGA